MARRMAMVAAFGLAISTVGTGGDAPRPSGKPGKGGKGGGPDRAAVYDKMDANGDGKVTADEYAASVADRAPGPGGKAPPADATAKRFAQLDANGDGTVSKDEYVAAPPRSDGGRGKGKAGGKGRPAP